MQQDWILQELHLMQKHPSMKDTYKKKLYFSCM